MGEIVVSTELENTVDWDIASEGLRDESTVRRTTVDGVADTGAVMPQDVVDRLGMRTRREVLVAHTNEYRETRQVAGPVTVQIGNRFMNADCIVGPPSSEPLIGLIVLEGLDLAADCGNRTFAPRPDSPDSPLLQLRSAMPHSACTPSASTPPAPVPTVQAATGFESVVADRANEPLSVLIDRPHCHD